MSKNNLYIAFDGFYVDDVRIVMFSLRPGWRWCNNGLWFCEEWALEDSFKSPTERTKDAMMGSLDGLIECLRFTVETGEEFEQYWLPTLDLSLKVDEMNQVQYQFFEKPTASKMCLQSDTALSQNCLVQSLVQDVIRRMLNCSSHTTPATRREVIDKFGQKMINSGHTIEETRRNILSGLKGWKTKVKRCKAANKPVHKSAKESAAGRRIKKLVGKSSWFKEKRDKTTGEETVNPDPQEGEDKVK